MTTMTTITTTRRGKFSTASSVLLLCVALLITKSCAIYALSGDSNLELVSQADAWNLVDEGSGWEDIISSSAKPEETTAEQQELTTTATEEVDPTTNQAETTTEIDTTAEPEEAATTSQPDEPQPATTAAPEEDKSTASPSDDVATSSTSADQPSTTEVEPVGTTIAPTPAPANVCPAAGLQPHIGDDCALFYNCQEDPLSGALLAHELVCPPLTVFSPTHKRCVRDLSECSSDEFVCFAPGRFAASSDTVYYLCEANMQGGYYKYLVRCSPGTIFESLWRRCWRYDWTQIYPGQSVEASDLAAIKFEQKQLKTEEKLRIKAEKQKEKEARKQKALEEKLAKKEAKKKAKEEAKKHKPFFIDSQESLESLSA